MGKNEKIIFEIIDWKRKNYNLQQRINKKLGLNGDILKNKLAELICLRDNIKLYMDRREGLKGYINKLKDYNKVLQIKKIKVYGKLL